MPKISVIVVTNRKGYLKILDDDMRRQTFRDFEVIVADDSVSAEELPQTDYYRNAPPEWYFFTPRQKNKGDAWNLNKAYNDCLDAAQGELLVFLQDFIWIPANGLERFWEMHQHYTNYLVTGVGHKALHGLKGISEVDDRVFAGATVTPGNFSHWELNWASCPRELMPRFNEEMDAFYGGENQYIAKKAGLPIAIDSSNQCIGYSQEECGGRQKDWEEKHSNKGALAHFLDNV